MHTESVHFWIHPTYTYVANIVLSTISWQFGSCRDVMILLKLRWGRKMTWILIGPLVSCRLGLSRGRRDYLIYTHHIDTLASTYHFSGYTFSFSLHSNAMKSGYILEKLNLHVERSIAAYFSYLVSIIHSHYTRMWLRVNILCDNMRIDHSPVVTTILHHYSTASTSHPLRSPHPKSP